MALYFDEAAGDKFIEGVEGAYAVVRKDAKHIELWDEDYEELLGLLPIGMTAAQINAAIKLYYLGISEGINKGKREKAREICDALGLRMTNATNE